MATVPSTISNISTINYEYISDPLLPPISESFDSNQFDIALNQAIIDNASGGMTKTASPEPVKLGDTITYTITLTNTGTATATNMFFKDTLPNGTVLVSGSPNPNPPSSIPVANLGPGASTSVSFQVLLVTLPTITTTISNIGSINFTYTLDPSIPNGGIGSGNSNVVTSNAGQAIIDNANGGMTKTATPNPAKLGDTITYNIALTNTGNVTATNVFFSDILPSGTVLVSGSPNPNPPSSIPVADLGPGASTSVTFQVLLVTLPTGNTTIPNTATVEFNYTADPSIPNGASGTGSSNTTVTNAGQAIIDNANGGMIKTATPAIAKLGDTITYNIALSNTGNVTATNVFFSDTLPSGTVLVSGSPNPNPPSSIPVADLGPGASTSVTFQVILVTLPTSTTIPNNASVKFNYTANPSLPNGASGSGDSNTIITSAGQAIIDNANGGMTKTATPNPVKLGDTITYNIALTNTGNVTATNVFFSDILPPGTVLVSGSPNPNPPSSIPVADLGPGASTSVTFQVLLVTLPTGNTTIPNTATVGFNYTEVASIPNGASGAGSSNTTVTNAGQAIIDNANGGMIKTAVPDPAKLGDTITYTVVLSNTGNVTATNIFFNDTLPLGTVLVSGSPNPNPPSSIPVADLGPGASTSINFQVILVTLPTSTTIPNDASIKFKYTADPSDPDGASGSGDSNTLITSAGQAIIDNASDGITKTATPAYAIVGSTITYTISLTNTGNATATNLFISDTLPSEVTLVSGEPNPNPPSNISVADLAPGASTSVNFKVIVNTLPVTGTITNTATAQFNYTAEVSNPGGASGLGDSNDVISNISNPALVITQTSSLDYATRNDLITYTITVENIGDLPLSAPVIFNQIPSEYSFVIPSLTIDGVPSSQDPITGVLIDDLAVGQTIVIMYDVIVENAPATNPITTVATANYSYDLGPDTINDSKDSNPDSIFVEIVDLYSPGNFIKASNVDYCSLGDTITYILSIINTGSAVGTNAILIDTLPNGLVFVNNSLEIDNIPTPGDITTGINMGTIQIDQLILVEFEALVVTIPDNGLLENSATINFNFTLDPSDPDGESGSEVSNISTVTARKPNFTGAGFTLSQSVDIITIDEYVVYTFTIVNSGNTAANNVMLDDLLVPELQFKTGSVNIDGTNYPLLNPNVGIPLSTINVAETVVVSFLAKVVSKPVPPTIDNIGTLSYTYTVDDANPDSYSESLDSNIVTLNYLDLEITITSSSNRPLGSIAGDTITYRVDVSNVGDIDAFNMILTETLSPNLSFVPGSVTVDGLPYPSYSPLVGIPLTTLPVGVTKTIFFDARVLPSTLPDMITTPTINYNYKLTPTMPTASREQDGPDVIVPNLTPMLDITKSADRAIVSLGTTITYKVVIKNTGNINLMNLILVDPLNPYIEYVGNLIINGVPSTDSILTGAAIGNLAIGETIVVFFDAVLVKTPPLKLIENTVTVNFEYDF